MKIAAIIGGGFIGAGWAARFLLNGWDVRVFDPDAEAPRKLGEVLDNARRSLPGLSDVSMPLEGTLSFHETLAEVVYGAIWIQECVPERLETKHEVLNALQAHCDHDAIIGSSTSGFRPSQLQQGATRPGQIIVAHPYNPVYLLPLVDFSATPVNDAAFIERAKATLSSLGMYPLQVKKETDAHIADRFLEAVRREAFWLVREGIATTQDIDHAIRYGFGILWAQMGLFETDRVAGGRAAMKHFIEQSGPNLKRPQTTLMEIPDLNGALISQIADQSNAQSGEHSIGDLERIRDNNLVGIMRALKAQDWGAGAIINARDRAVMVDTGVVHRADQIDDAAAPLETLARAVPLDWTDYNGHMNEARYLQAFGDATDRVMEIVGCDSDYISSGGSYFTAETHIRHIDEVLAGTRISVRTKILNGAGKKMHLWHEMHAGTRLLATAEHIMIHVDLATRRPSDPSAKIAKNLARLAAPNAGQPLPEGAGRYVGAPR